MKGGVDWFTPETMDPHYAQVESDMVLHTFAEKKCVQMEFYLPMLVIN